MQPRSRKNLLDSLRIQIGVNRIDMVNEEPGRPTTRLSSANRFTCCLLVDCSINLVRHEPETPLVAVDDSIAVQVIGRSKSYEFAVWG